jgi:predicted nucleic acid-binding protein
LILVDSSVWVAAFRRTGQEAEQLARLLDDDRVLLAIPVRVEILCGASRSDRPRLRRTLSALPVILPSERTWPWLEQCVDRSADAGQRFGFADLLIAALAAENQAEVWSLDSDFARMARLGMVRLHRPGG